MSGYSDTKDPYFSNYKPTIAENRNSVFIRTFKQRTFFAWRQHEAEGIRQQYPNKIPVIIERSSKETHLSMLNRVKFLIPEELTMSQLLSIIRNRLSLNSTQAIFLLLDDKHIASMSSTLAEVYRDWKDRDGFLYVTYASQETFGSQTIIKMACGKMQCLHWQYAVADIQWHAEI